jgi:hypothetical protein
VRFPDFDKISDSDYTFASGVDIYQEIAMGRPAATWLFAQLFGSADGKEWSTDYWYHSAGGAPPANFDPKQLANDFFVALNGAVSGVMYNAFQLQGAQIEVNFGSGTYGAKYYQPVAGGLSTGPMPEEVSVVVRKFSTTGGRSYTGQNRYTMIDQSLCTGSYLNATGLTTFGAVTANTLATFASQTITYTPQIYSKKLNVLTPIIGLQTIALLGTVRRRRPRF